jgi:hypothetical protein
MKKRSDDNKHSVRYTVTVDENEIDMMMKIEIGSRI